MDEIGEMLSDFERCLKALAECSMKDIELNLNTVFEASTLAEYSSRQTRNYTKLVEHLYFDPECDLYVF